MTHRMQKHPVGKSLTPTVPTIDEVVIVNRVGTVKELFTQGTSAFLTFPQLEPLRVPDGLRHPVIVQLFTVDEPLRIEGVVVPLDF